MFRNMLVVLEENPEAVTAYAISLAKRLEARPTVIRPRRDRQGLSDGSLEARLEIARGDASTRKAMAREALEAFGEQAKAAGVDAEILLPDGGADPRRDQVAVFARVFAFSIVGQPESGRPPQLDEIAGQLLEDSGRPVLVVPAIQRTSASFGTIAVAWDGSATAARAFGDAMPILERADKVEIISIAGPNTPQAVSQGGERLAAQMRQGGVSAAFRRLPSDDDPANALLSYIADIGADMLIAGGYGHSRLREALFGGVTRSLLGSQTLPLFLSH
jgi:nucleotide-binding universal stress UspA family protein